MDVLLVVQYWLLPEEHCKKNLLNFNTEMAASKVGNPCQLLASRIFISALGERKTARNRHGKILCIEFLRSWPTLGQLLANSPPWEVAEVFLAIVLSSVA